METRSASINFSSGKIYENCHQLLICKSFNNLLFCDALSLINVSRSPKINKQKPVLISALADFLSTHYVCKINASWLEIHVSVKNITSFFTSSTLLPDPHKYALIS